MNPPKLSGKARTGSLKLDNKPTPFPAKLAKIKVTISNKLLDKLPNRQLTKREAIKLTREAMRAARKGEDLTKYISRMAKSERLQKLFVVSENLKLMKAVAEKTTSVVVMSGLRAVLRFTKGSSADYSATIKAFVDKCNKSTNPKIVYLLQGMAGYKVDNPAKIKARLVKYFKQKGMSSGAAKTEARRRLRDVYPRNIKLSKMILAKYSKKDSAVMIELIKSGSREVQIEAVKSPALKDVRLGTLKVLLRAAGTDVASLQVYRKLATFNALNDRVVSLMWGSFVHGKEGALKGASARDYQLGLALSKHPKLSTNILTKMVSKISAPSIREREVLGRNLAKHPNCSDTLVAAMWKRFPAIQKDSVSNQRLVKNKNVSDRMIKLAKTKNPNDAELADTISSKRPRLSA